MRVEFTRAATNDLEDIGDRIAQRNPQRAVSYLEELRRRALRIAEFPHAGPPLEAWGVGVRVAIHGRYLIIYRARADVVHGARDLDALLTDEPLPDE